MTAKKPSPQSVTLQTTTDYGKFVAHRNNRVLLDADTNQPLLRQDLVKSMQAEGYRPEEPITAYVNDDGTYTVIDGHNRLFAAQSLGLPVWYAAHKRNGRAEWTPLKSSAMRKNWTAVDFARAYAHEGNPHYAELLDYVDRTGIKISNAASVLYGQAASSGNALRHVRNGTFVIKDRINSDILADLVGFASKYIDWAHDDRLISAFSVLLFVPGFSPVQMKDKMSRHAEYLEKKKDRDATIEMLEQVYNLYSKNRLNLLFETRRILAKRRSR